MEAICIKCGGAKKLPWHKCGKCGFVPDGDDLVKSVYCSIARFSGDGVRTENYKEELKQMQVAIRQGKTVDFDRVEIERLKKDQILLDHISPAMAWRAVFGFFLPAILLLGGIYLLLWIMRR